MSESTPTAMVTAVMPKFRLDGRRALVTGAGAGIGAAIAAALAEAGAEVIMLSLKGTELQARAAAIRDAGGNVSTVKCDVTDTAKIRQFIGELDSLDILVNNAGTNIPEPFVDVTDEHLDFMSDLNTRATFSVAQAAVRKMLQHPDRLSRGGAVVNITSQMGHVGSPGRTVYCMNKHAVEGLTKAMAVELAPLGIRVNAVGPTFIDTPLVRRIVDTPEKEAFLFSKIPLGRLGQVEEIAAAVLFLVSPAASLVTGASLLVDGGWTAQ